MTPIVLLNVKTLGIPAYRESVQDSRCWRGLWGEPGLLRPHRWLTDQWKRLKYELLYCFTPHSVKWNDEDEFRRHSSVCFRRKHNESRTEVTALWEYHQHSFTTSSFLKRNWRSGELVCCPLSLRPLLCVVPLYCLAVIQLCKPESVKAPPNKV